MRPEGTIRACKCRKKRNLNSQDKSKLKARFDFLDYWESIARIKMTFCTSKSHVLLKNCAFRRINLTCRFTGERFWTFGRCNFSRDYSLTDLKFSIDFLMEDMQPVFHNPYLEKMWRSRWIVYILTFSTFRTFRVPVFFNLKNLSIKASFAKI